MQTLHETELTYTQDHKLDLNGMARTLLEDLVNTVMVEQVEELGCVRNGYRERKLVTSVGTLTLELSKQVQRLVMVDFPRALPTQTLTWP